MQVRRLFLVFLLAAFFALLAILIGGLNQLEFSPGKPLPGLFAKRPDTTSGTARPIWSLEMEQVRSLLFAVITINLVIGVVWAIFSRRFRRSLLISSIVALALLLALMHVRPPEGSLLEEPQPVEGAFLKGSTEGEIQVEIPEPSPPNWVVILIAVGAAVLAAGLAVLFYLNVYPVLRRRRKGDGLLAELAVRAGEAMERIHAGTDLRDAVLRCYKEMSDLLSREVNIHDVAVLTPREFAQGLRARGMQNQHVDRLTAIFEQVRYGGREGAAFANEAIACLEAIKRAYAPVGTP